MIGIVDRKRRFFSVGEQIMSHFSFRGSSPNAAQVSVKICGFIFIDIYSLRIMCMNLKTVDQQKPTTPLKLIVSQFVEMYKM